LFESDSLPDIGLRPDSAARSTRVVTSLAASSTATASRLVPKPPSVRNDFPLTPAQLIDKYKRQLTPYELQEVLDYPQVYFFGPLAHKIQASEEKPNNSGYDDDKGRYKCMKHDHIGYRYEILKGLGKGSFGDVVKTFDHKTKTHQAVKIIRNEKRFHKQGQIEVKLLEMLKKQDKRGTANLIHINESFTFRNHLCITFDLMHQDLYSALKKDSFKGFTLSQVQRFCVSILNCLKLLRKNHVIHCDLKPENILLQSKDTDDIKVIDFGSACYDNQKIHTYIQSRFYRAPEVILGCGYTMAIDMWSLGCILAELYSGQPLFPGRDEPEQLMYQMEILGKPSKAVLTASKRFSVFFEPNDDPKTVTDRKGVMHVPNSKLLASALGTKDPDFVDFVQGEDNLLLFFLC
jgi:dual specificity tyrosine-phosphorylation-regulated kinase 2/3/4